MSLLKRAVQLWEAKRRLEPRSSGASKQIRSLPGAYRVDELLLHDSCSSNKTHACHLPPLSAEVYHFVAGVGSAWVEACHPIPGFNNLAGACKEEIRDSSGFD